MQPFQFRVECLYRVLTIGQVIVVLGLLVFSAALIHEIIAVSKSGSGPHQIDEAIRTTFMNEPYTGTFSKPMRFLSLVFMVVESISGILAFWMSFGLFAAYKRGEIFTLRSAKRLNLIGWLIFALAPLSILTNLVGKAIYMRWIDPTDITVSLQFEDGDFYAVVFGLLIVIVSHVMKQAIAISEENKEFV